MCTRVDVDNDNTSSSCMKSQEEDKPQSGLILSSLLIISNPTMWHSCCLFTCNWPVKLIAPHIKLPYGWDHREQIIDVIATSNIQIDLIRSKATNFFSLSLLFPPHISLSFFVPLPFITSVSNKAAGLFIAFRPVRSWEQTGCSQVTWFTAMGNRSSFSAGSHRKLLFFQLLFFASYSPKLLL